MNKNLKLIIIKKIGLINPRGMDLPSSSESEPEEVGETLLGGRRTARDNNDQNTYGVRFCSFFLFFLISLSAITFFGAFSSFLRSVFLFLLRLQMNVCICIKRKEKNLSTIQNIKQKG